MSIWTQVSHGGELTLGESGPYREGVSTVPSCCVWLTGRRGSGKTTVARSVAAELHRRGTPVAVVDEAEVREHLGDVDPIGACGGVARLVLGGAHSRSSWYSTSRATLDGC